MRIGIVTREWPPDVYGGAGVHVEHLVAALRSLSGGPEIDVHCFGDPRPDATAHAVPPGLKDANGALQAIGVDVEMAAALTDADLVHSHTWYANTAGLLSSLVYGVPHVITAHSLEPRRPWKADQLGGGYRLSSWVERTAYLAADGVIAVSRNLLERPEDGNLRGVFHMAGSGFATWAEFATGIFALSARLGGPSAKVRPIATAHYPTPAKRPLNSRLDCTKLKEVHGVVLPHWRDSLEPCVKRLIEEARKEFTRGKVV